jgi:hypothetical protein
VIAQRRQALQVDVQAFPGFDQFLPRVLCFENAIDDLQFGTKVFYRIECDDRSLLGMFRKTATKKPTSAPVPHVPRL